MQFKDLEPGVYPARIKDWGVEEVAIQGKTVFRANIDIDLFLETEGEWISSRWNTLVTTKDGVISKKFLNTMTELDFKYGSLEGFAKTDAFDLEKTIYATVDIEQGNDGKEYKRITWLNANKGGGLQQMKKVTDVKSLRGINFAGEMKLAKQDKTPAQKPIKNYAEDVKTPPKINEGEELPF